MSKHLPNCPHLSKYDGLGDAGIIMAINEKWRQTHQNNRNEIDNLITKAISDIDKELEENRSRFKKNTITKSKKSYKKEIRNAYINGYKQGKEDTINGIVRDPLDMWSQYWNKK